MSHLPFKLKSLIRIIGFILLVISLSFLGYGIYGVIDSKQESDSKKEKAFLSSGITSIIIGGSILLIELFLIILFAIYKYAKIKNII